MLGNNPLNKIFAKVIIIKTLFALAKHSAKTLSNCWQPRWISRPEFCCLVWAGVPSCYLELLEKLQKWICRTIGPSLAASLEPLACHQNVASSSLFYMYYFGKCSSELARLVPLSFSWGTPTQYFDILHDFYFTIPRCYKDVCVNSFFPCTSRLWNSLPIEWFHLIYNLNDFKSRINRHPLTVGS